jgi:hypothetical protein
MPPFKTKQKAGPVTPEKLQGDFVKLIQKTSKENGVIAAVLCDNAGISEGHWSSIQTGYKNLTLDTMSRLAFALGKKVSLTLV